VIVAWSSTLWMRGQLCRETLRDVVPPDASANSLAIASLSAAVRSNLAVLTTRSNLPSWVALSSCCSNSASQAPGASAPAPACSGVRALLFTLFHCWEHHHPPPSFRLRAGGAAMMRRREPVDGMSGVQ
jgi:hypothetical protein